VSSTDPPLPPSPDEPTDEPQWGGEGSGDDGRGDDVRGDDGPGGGETDTAGSDEPGEAASPPELPTEAPPAGDVPTELLAADDTEVTSVLPTTGDDLTEPLPPTGDEPTAVLAGAAAATADGTGEWTREHRRRVSHRRYVMRRVGVGILALALVGGGIALLVALLGGDGDDAGGADSTVPESTEAAAPPATKPAVDTAAETSAAVVALSTAPATTEATASESETTTAAPATEPEETEPAEITTEETAAEGGSDTTEATESSPPGSVAYDLEPEASCEIGQTLRRGDSGPQVQCLQERLNEVTIGGEDLPEDGAFGEQTDAAVRAFQEANELRVDGVVGPATGELLGIWAA
jgi:hypothetical protein